MNNATARVVTDKQTHTEASTVITPLVYACRVLTTAVLAEQHYQSPDCQLSSTVSMVKYKTAKPRK